MRPAPVDAAVTAAAVAVASLIAGFQLAGGGASANSAAAEQNVADVTYAAGVAAARHGGYQGLTPADVYNADGWEAVTAGPSLGPRTVSVALPAAGQAPYVGVADYAPIARRCFILYRSPAGTVRWSIPAGQPNRCTAPKAADPPPGAGRW